MKVVIAAGGTGGHIYPALALADILKKEKPDTDILFFGSSGRMEAEVIPARGYRFHGEDMTGTNGGVAAKVRSLLSLVKAGRKCRKLLKEERPDICVGFGNYISVPLILTAHAMKIPTMIHEQNSFAGKANRLLSRSCDAIVTCYASNEEQMPKEKIRLLGNPQATTAADTGYDPSVLTEMGLDPEKPFVLVMMGSLGSESVSGIIDQACAMLDRSYQVVIAAGRDNEYEFTHTDPVAHRVVPYVDGKKMLKGCEAAVLRAGATTMAEIGAIGCAAILIPSPFVPNNHQYYNAAEYADQGAAILLEEKDLTPEKLAAELNALMKDDAKRAVLRENTKKAGRRDAAYRMIEWMEELADGR
ncbi:MAG: UDP-N-acetylglucosamine--N-acetylmuramyl-(pentapeptide) pyrophosphoryl-undecaprenol N-acetylglucosamine transferase [Solobacterium sp.]|nr:UDP-N-acetylglucosamine--N-acetylmuramyl-(pentapeptide) pyrophosphoryl-undecaprenol N-acetylglucosamine transferase [Solobacterium sp.]